ncbi:MAG: tRNA (adenosine(37)-N6)-threonylcarbamoyltransferase complex ATPase subunit type 1 TsaE [Dehalococcoidales bacterium]|nr:tRNA (adenosine(37)-N6)-threonylcarbamoyltransferase complex ATPase subunit type 1 TsaE [Dehalococcoidales bacterium]
MSKYQITSVSPAATMNLGKKIGQLLKPGGVISLIGELGCGKTLITRGICGGLGVPARQVNSPTFQLVNEYRGRLTVFHIDLYRLSGIDDSIDIGITDYFSRAREGIMVIEWAEKIIDLLPPGLLKIEFDIISKQKRHIVLSSTSRRFAGLFKELRGK